MTSRADAAPSQRVQPPEAIVESMATLGRPVAEIARALGVTVDELRRDYAAELANGTVANALWRAATNAEAPNVRAAIFWLKSRASWIDAPSKPSTPARAKPKAAGYRSKKAAAQDAAASAERGTPWAKLLKQ